MTGIEHAILATLTLFVFYQWGRISSNKKDVKQAIENTLDTLEKNGFIMTKTLKNGEKELVKVVDIWKN